MGVARRNLTIAVLMVGGLAASSPAAANDEELPGGVIVVVGVEPESSLMRGAGGLSGADFVVQHLVPEPALPPTDPTASIDGLLDDYLVAAFVECLDRFDRQDLQLATLLPREQREAAGRAVTVAAACAHGASEVDRATRLLRSLFAVEIDPSRFIEHTTPAFQELIEEVRSEAQAQPRQSLTLMVRPAGAELWLDGARLRCADRQCQTEVRAGEHFLTARQLGFRDLVTQVQVSSDRTIDVTMDPTTSREASEQLTTWLANHDIDHDRVARAASIAFERPIVVLSWTDQAGVHTALYDARIERTVARSTFPAGPDQQLAAVRAAVSQWQSEVGPRRVARNPWFWIGIVGTVATATGLYFILRDPGDQFDVRLNLGRPGG